MPAQSTTGTISATGKFMSDRNGRVNFCLTTTTPEAGACPNGNWTGAVTDVSFGTVTIKVNGQVVQ